MPCISRVSEHCRRKPLLSSTEPEKGGGLTMVMATYTGGEEEFGEVTGVLGAEAGAGTVRTLRRLSISSCNGSVVVRSGLLSG